MNVVDVLLFCVTAFAIWRDTLPLVTRLVALAERVYTVTDEKKDDVFTTATKHPLPEDIESLALAESEDWAKDAVRERARELFAATNGDWDQTRIILRAERQATIFGGTGEGRA